MKKELKSIEAITQIKDGKMTAIASTEDKDRQGDVLKVMDWNFERFKANPVLQAGHDYRPQYTVGIAKNIRVVGKEVLFEPVFHAITPLAKQIKQMYEEGILKAWSVGFIPAREKGQKHELLEVSAVAVPANAYALMKGFTENDANLETELKSWKDAVLDDEEAEEDDEENADEEASDEEKEYTDADDFSEEAKGVDEKGAEADAVKKGEVAVETGETENHTHTATYDEDSGDGVTSEAEGHTHDVLNFEVQPGGEDGHTHTLDTEAAKPTDEVAEPEPEAEASGYGGKKPKKPMKGFKEAWNKNLPAIFHKEFDVSEVETGKTLFQHEILAKFFECEVKELYVNNFEVPSPLLGSYLKGFQQVFGDLELVETRNWHGDLEFPPMSETIQLTADKSEDFLVEGTQFYKVAGKNGLAVKFSPGWTGMYVTLVAHVDRKEWCKETMDKVHKWVKENNLLKGQKFSVSGSFIPRGNKTFDDLIADAKNVDAVKKSLKVLDKNLGSRGILMMGKPGTGKTMTGKVLVDSNEATFIWISAKDMSYFGYLGTMRLGFQLARDLAPSILFMEDIDDALKWGGVDILKTEMDGIQENRGMVTILTSNFPEDLPEALIDRPGRFHKVLHYELPNAEIRAQMLVKWAGVTKEVAEKFAAQTEGYSGAYIKELVEFAEMIAADEGIEMEAALEKSLKELEEQRELIHNVRNGFKSYDTIALKEGRVISRKNMEKLAAAKEAMSKAGEAIDEVIKIGTEETTPAEKPVEVPSEEKVAPVVEKRKVTSDDVALKVLKAIAKQANLGIHETRKAAH